MKNKYVKYGLLVVVAFVWGKIVIDYFGLFEGNDNPDYIPEKIIRPVIKTAVVKNYELSLNYQDPFLSQNRATIESKPNNVNTSSVVLPNKLPVSSNKKEPKLVYKGLVKNKSSSRKTGLIIIDGKSHLITTNFKTEVISIVSFNEAECKYLYNGEIVSVSK